MGVQTATPEASQRVAETASNFSTQSILCRSLKPFLGGGENGLDLTGGFWDTPPAKRPSVWLIGKERL